MDTLERKDDAEDIVVYRTLDKDYGRTRFAGPGYGELDLDKYKELEELVKE